MYLASIQVTLDVQLHLNQGRMLTLHVECVIKVDLPYIELDWNLAMYYQGYGIQGEFDQHQMSLETNLEH